MKYIKLIPSPRRHCEPRVFLRGEAIQHQYNVVAIHWIASASLALGVAMTPGLRFCYV